MLIKEVLVSATRIIKVIGSIGVGKTRLVKEVGNFINERRLVTEGVYYLNFTNVSTQDHVNRVFKEVGIEHLFTSLTVSTGTSPRGIQKQDKQILLIYDCIDDFVKNKSLFKWHTKQMLKASSKLKIIFISRKKVMPAN